MTGNPLDGLAGGASAVNAGLAITGRVASLTEHFKPYKPEVKSFRIDYLSCSSELKYLLEIPSGIGRKTRRRVEVPMSYGFKIYDVVDMETGSLVKVDFDQRDSKWVSDLDGFPHSEKFLVTVRGTVGQDFLARLVDVKASANPVREAESDRYWLHAALKDVGILERVWTDLAIDRVNVDVRIGVERFFTTAIPEGVKRGLALQQKLLDAIRRGERNIEGLKAQYRMVSITRGVTPEDLYSLVRRLASGEFFGDYIMVDHPFVLGGIEPEQQFASLVPERVKVGAVSDLSFRMPAAKGDLMFKRKEYVRSVSDEIRRLAPKEKSKGTSQGGRKRRKT